MRWLILAFLLAAPAAAQDKGERIEVDMELVLAVDVSRSMSPRELEIQRRGYAEALASPEVMAAIERGYLGRIAIAYMEWAGVGSQRVVAGWTILETPEDAAAFAEMISATATATMRRTSISDGLLVAADLFRDSPYTSWRKVIDISGDGPNNQGMAVTAARDSVLVRDITINGLPLMTRDGAGAQWHLEDLDLYYEACVIGGLGAFVIPVHDWGQFATAVRRKLVLEISGLAASGLVPAQSEAPPAYDCLIGEKIWERNRMDWSIP